MSDTWSLPHGSDCCGRCEAALEPHAVVTTSLSLDAEGPVRQDLCETCGQAVQEGDDGEAFFWRRSLPEPDRPMAVVDYAMLREIFDRMLTRSGSLYERLVYLVALVLVRKRHLKLRGFERREGREVMVVTRGAGQPEQVVPAPFLTAEDMAETRDHLTRLLAADLPDLDALEEPPDGQDPAGGPGSSGAEAAGGSSVPEAEGAEAGAPGEGAPEGEGQAAGGPPEVEGEGTVGDEPPAAGESEAPLSSARPELN